jgi:hypothetical protein
MAASGFALRMASGDRRLTIHCRFCGATLPCPLENDDIWFWLNKDDAQQFYRVHREHAGVLADQLVGAEIEFDDGLTAKKEEKLPPLMNLLDPKNMALIEHG